MTDRIRAIHGDSREVLKSLADDSVDSCVCDPPYSLVSIVKRFGANGAAPAKGNDAYMRASSGFMGQKWDTGETAHDPEFWREVYRVLKPGAHVVAFGGTRTFHRLVCAIEDAGFEVRDMIAFLYGSGFPKSHNVGRKIDACSCARPEAAPPFLQRDVRRVPGSDVSEAVGDEAERCEVLLESVSEHGLSRAMLWPKPQEGAQAGEQSSMEGRRNDEAPEGELHRRSLRQGTGVGKANGASGRLHNGTPAGHGSDVRLPADAGGMREPSGSSPLAQRAEELGAMADERGSQAWGGWPLCGRCSKPLVPEGLGTALKPALEPICLARKPIAGTVAANVAQHGTGGLNINACRVPSADDVGDPQRFARVGQHEGWDRPHKHDEVLMAERASARFDRLQKLGRWPANVIHDGSEEVVGAFPETLSGSLNPSHVDRGKADGILGQYNGRTIDRDFGGDAGSAARFFYTAKADSDDRIGSKHPTVKPIDLMQYLIRLVTPKNGLVLDPFAGTGTTGEAAFREGCWAILIEREPQYFADIQRRISLLLAGPDERARESIKASGKVEHPGPLFGEVA